MSDHSVVCLDLDIPLPKPEKTLRISCNYKTVDRVAFVKALGESIQTSEHHPDAESCFKWYNGIMQSLLDSFAPLTVEMCAVRRRMP